MIDPKASGNTGRHLRAHGAVPKGKPCLSSAMLSWAEAPIKIARMTLTIKLDGNWSSFQLANSAPPLSVTDSAIAPSARMHNHVQVLHTDLVRHVTRRLPTQRPVKR